MYLLIVRVADKLQLDAYLGEIDKLLRDFDEYDRRKFPSECPASNVLVYGRLHSVRFSLLELIASIRANANRVALCGP